MEGLEWGFPARGLPTGDVYEACEFFDSGLYSFADGYVVSAYYPDVVFSRKFPCAQHGVDCLLGVQMHTAF